MARRTKAEKALDMQIEQTYYRLARGRQIDIMDIGKVFAEGHRAAAEGRNLEIAIQEAVDKYTMVSGS